MPFTVVSWEVSTPQQTTEVVVDVPSLDAAHSWARTNCGFGKGYRVVPVAVESVPEPAVEPDVAPAPAPEAPVEEAPVAEKKTPRKRSK